MKQAAACLLSAATGWSDWSSLDGTEFSGGWITGPMLNMKEVGSVLFFFALLLTFFYRRIAAAVSLIACLLGLPLYVYFIAPCAFRPFFYGAEWSPPLRTTFVWDSWTITRIIVLAVTAYFTVRSGLIAAAPQSRNSE